MHQRKLFIIASQYFLHRRGPGFIDSNARIPTVLRVYLSGKCYFASAPDPRITGRAREESYCHWVSAVQWLNE
jgi:hypothetical protein